MEYPKVSKPNKVGKYPALAKSGGGYVWDEVLEYRVWVHPELGADDSCEGDDYFYAFENYEEALKYSNSTQGAESPLALILQQEYIDEPSDGQFILVKEPRITEWRVEWLSRKKRDPRVVAAFFKNPTAERVFLLRQ